jgi:hypothetical protein
MAAAAAAAATMACIGGGTTSAGFASSTTTALNRDVAGAKPDWRVGVGAPVDGVAVEGTAAPVADTLDGAVVVVVDVDGAAVLVGAEPLPLSATVPPAAATAASSRACAAVGNTERVAHRRTILPTRSRSD